MPGALEISSIVQNKIRQLGIPVMLLSELSGVSNATLSRWFAGSPIGRAKELHVNSHLASLEKLIRLTAPLPLDFRQSATIKKLLAKVSDGDLLIQIQDGARNSPIPSAVGGLSALAGFGTGFQTFESACTEELSVQVSRLLNGRKRQTYENLKEK